MGGRVRIGWTAPKILGLVFSLLGGVFLAVSGLLQILVPHIPVGLIFLGLGGCFFLFGLGFLVGAGMKTRRSRGLVEAGRYVWGEVVDIQVDYSVEIGGRHPRRLVVCYIAPDGKKHLFHSDGVRFSPGKDLLGRQVKVYCDPENLNKYYVDAQSLLEGYVIH